MRLVYTASFILFFAVVRAQAAAYYYPVGHTEALMGGNSTAMVGSPMGLAFNPSILGTLESPAFSVSGSSYFITKAESGSSKFSSFTAVPNSVVSSWTMGKGSLAMGLIIPKSQDAQFTATVPASYFAPGSPETMDLKVSYTTTRTLVGAGWGQRVGACGDDCEVFAGASLFFSNDELKRDILLVYQPTTIQVGQMTSVSTSASTNSLLAMLGGTWRKGRDRALGVRLELPSILVRSGTGGESISQSYINGNPSGPEHSIVKKSVNDAIPGLDQWSLSVGSWIRSSEKWSWVSNFDIGERPKPLSSTDTGESTIEVSGGARYQLNEKYALHSGTRVGLQSLFLPSSDTEYRTVQVLLTGGVSWWTKDLESTIGAFDLFNIVRSSPDPSKTAPATLDPASVQYYGLMLSAQYKF